MAVPTTIADLSTTASSNSPAGSEAIGTSLDDFLRSIQSITKQNVSKGADIASSSTITIPASGSYFIVTGTTTITAIADTNSWAGRIVVLRFGGALTLTHAAGLVLPDGANITTAIGDVCVICNESTGAWRVVSYLKYGGTSALLAANGYQRLPSGLIIQWGAGSTTNGVGSVTFPIAFPSVCRHFHGQYGGASSAADSLIVSNSSPSNTSVTIYASDNAGSGATTAGGYSWQAIGY